MSFKKTAGPTPANFDRLSDELLTALLAITPFSVAKDAYPERSAHCALRVACGRFNKLLNAPAFRTARGALHESAQDANLSLHVRSRYPIRRRLIAFPRLDSRPQGTTLLHVAVFTGRSKWINHIFQAGADMTPADEVRWRERGERSRTRGTCRLFTQPDVCRTARRRCTPRA